LVPVLITSPAWSSWSLINKLDTYCITHKSLLLGSGCIVANPEVSTQAARADFVVSGLPAIRQQCSDPFYGHMVFSYTRVKSMTVIAL
jgi:hypothetical protein